MALPKKQLQEKLENITPETVKEVLQWILDGHTASLEAVQEERDTYKAQAATLQAVTQERDDYKQKYEAKGDAAKVQADFDAYKQQVEAKEKAAKEDAEVLDICKAAGVTRDSFLRLVAKDFDRGQIKRGEDGSVTNREGLLKYVQDNYKDYVATTDTHGAGHVDPPGDNSGGGRKLSRAAEIARQYKENLYGTAPEKKGE